MSLPKTPLTDLDMMLKDKAAFLTEMFLTYIVDPANDSHFGLVMKWFLEEGIVSDKDMAREFEVAKTTVRRWAIGTARPHPVLRKEIIKWIIRESNKYFKEQNRQ